MSCYFKIICFSNIEDEIKEIANKHVEYIKNIQDELQQYKKFHDEIIDNDVIKRKFSDYEEKIKKLEDELYACKKE